MIARSSVEPVEEMPEPPRLTVVIVNYNGWDDVARLVETLATEPETRAGRCEILVVDNASTGEIPESLARLAPQDHRVALVACPPGHQDAQPERPTIRLILRDDNGGFSVGVNAGFRESRSPWILVLNPDVVAEPGLLGKIFARIDHHEASANPPAIVGFRLQNEDGSTQPSVGAPIGLMRSLIGQLVPRSRRKYRSRRRSRPGPVAWVTGACMLVNSGVMRSIGGMDEDFFLYYEEVALCRSVQKRGHRVEFDDTVSVTHLRPLQDRPVSPRMRVITRHSKLLYFRKHLPRWQFLTLSYVIAIEARFKTHKPRAKFVRGWPVSLLKWGGRPCPPTEKHLVGGQGRPPHSVQAPSDVMPIRFDEEARSWSTIAAIAQAMRQGREIRGRDVLALADATVQDAGARRDSAFQNARPTKPPMHANSSANRQ